MSRARLHELNEYNWPFSLMESLAYKTRCRCAYREIVVQYGSARRCRTAKRSEAAANDLTAITPASIR